MKLATRKGFTLIEILIVVIILGILAAIVIPQFTSASNDAKTSAVQSTVQAMQTQCQVFAFQTNTVPGLSGSSTTFWNDLGTRYNVDGKTVGPWVNAPAVNPYTNSNTVAFGGAAPASAAAVGSWFLDTVNNKFYGYMKTATGTATFYPSPN